MEESVLLGTKPLVDSIRHFIRDPSGVFSVSHDDVTIPAFFVVKRNWKSLYLMIQVKVSNFFSIYV